MDKIRPYTTLFMLASVDGKISTGDIDERDTDKDFKTIDGVKEGRHQYYELEKKTDLFSLNSGKVMAKIGVNTRTEEPKKMGVSFIIIDNQPHLDKKGVLYLTKWVKKLYLVTTNKNHPAFETENVGNLEVIYYEGEVDLKNLMTKLKQDYKIEKLTIQSGGTLNAEFLRKGLIDRISFVFAPCLIGGKNTPTLIDGESLREDSDLQYIKALRLVECNPLESSYLHLVYEVIH